MTEIGNKVKAGSQVSATATSITIDGVTTNLTGGSVVTTDGASITIDGVTTQLTPADPTAGGTKLYNIARSAWEAKRAGVGYVAGVSEGTGGLACPVGIRGKFAIGKRLTGASDMFGFGKSESGWSRNFILSAHGRRRRRHFPRSAHVRSNGGDRRGKMVCEHRDSNNKTASEIRFCSITRAAR